MPSSTRSNKETQLLFSSDPASLERSIRKGIRSSSIDNNTCSSLDFRQSPSNNTRFPPSTEDTLPSIHRPTSSIRFRSTPGHEGHMRNAADDDFWQVVKQEKLQEGDFEVEISMSFGGSHLCRSTLDFEHRSIDFNQNRSTGSLEHRSMTPTESTATCNAKENAVDRQPPAHIDRRVPLTYRVQMPKIDVAHLNALRPQPKLSDNLPEAIKTPSDDAADPMEADRVPMGRTLRKRKEKVAKHLKRGANEKERESFQK
ncbi:hypothetical protein F2Q69_00013120 [Brassica cretica]|uniref:Uncharacterized protein n=1 Tax=Brassica cretica TaxID=69181 RepID=A0A8S9R4A4_BRACR|nr:hypothetical protein F2Q69_00013120 [Brassica cretica]